MLKLKIGIAGAGFGASFQFHLHPQCKVEAIADTTRIGRETLSRVYQCNKAYSTLNEMLNDKEVNAVFIATPAPLHAQHTIHALQAGKHVLSAVPVALSIEDCFKVLEEVKKSGLIYMMAETSYYRQSTITARNFYNEGRFGKIFHTIAEYSHPGLEEYFFADGKPTWRHGLPPMYYPTHCIAFLTGVTGERLTSVSCRGWGDEDDILRGNLYNNSFWNERALFGTNEGNSLLVSINWRGALQNVEKADWLGTHMSLTTTDDSVGTMRCIRKSKTVGHDDGGFRNEENTVEEFELAQWWKTKLLPEPLRINTGHGGSHCFITHEFVDAVVNLRQPAIDIYEALSCTIPGLVAHESALKSGALLSIPSF